MPRRNRSKRSADKMDSEVRAELMDAKQVFLDYAERFDHAHNSKMELKIVHTMAVADVMKQLTDALQLPKRTAYLAHLCAMFHDVGRFEQLRRYDTFLDYKSVDHAALGCEVLVQEKILEELPEREQEMVLAAIHNHNKFRIEEGLDEETMLLCKLIRDADKCDIFRVFACEDMVDTMGETLKQVAQETVSDLMLQSILEHRCVKKEDRKTGLDIWVGFLAFFFDLYFKESIAIAKGQGYYRQPFDRISFAEPETRRRVEKILEEVENYITDALEQ